MEQSQHSSRTLLVLLPSLRISGGVQESLLFGAALAKRGVDVRVLVLWKHPHELDSMGLPVDYLSTYRPVKSRALWQFPLLLMKYPRYMFRSRNQGARPLSLLLTHYSTIPFAWLTPGLERWLFVLDLEWKFVPVPLRVLVRWLILFTSRRSKIITTNEFVSSCYLEQGVTPFAHAPLWASSFWLDKDIPRDRPFDVGMLLRYGSVKRPDLYFEFLDLLKKEPSLRCALTTPESTLYEKARPLVEYALLRPSNEELRQFYGSCKIFVLLSDTEGFGLPPLEAMGSGCVPFCRDSGGVRCYMQGSLAINLIPAEENISSILARLKALLSCPEELDALSGTARSSFAEGLRVSQAEREDGLNRIAAYLKGDPQT